MDRTRHVTVAFLAGVVVLAALSVRYLSGARYTPPPPVAEPVIAEPVVDPGPQLLTEHLAISNGDTLDEILAQAGIEDAQERFEIANTFDDAFSVRKLRAGTELLMERWDDTGDLESLEYQIDPDHRVELRREEGVSVAEVVEIPGTIEVVPVCTTLRDSMYLTMQRAGEDPYLGLRMAEIFRFDIDFYRDPQPGDQFCILVERKFYTNGQPPSDKRILAAKYVNNGTTYDAFLFGDDDSYYASDGHSLQSTFLRAPLAISARISSHFSRSRLHPVLGVRRAHLGTDYAAPTGTPVLAVADGRVVESSYTSGNGNYVAIQHANGYRTMYLHFSKRLVKAGQRVKQGQRIGLVGATGLATGPHLDIRITQNGKALDWERMRAPRTVSLTKQQLEQFRPEQQRLAAMMDNATRTLKLESYQRALDELPEEFYRGN